jgi:hypothetical protein
MYTVYKIKYPLWKKREENDEKNDEKMYKNELIFNNDNIWIIYFLCLEI